MNRHPIEPETIASDPLLLKAMMRFHFSDPLIERLLITLRQSILLNSSRDLAIDSGYMSFVVALSDKSNLMRQSGLSANKSKCSSIVNQLATKILQITELKAEDISAIMLLTMMYQPLAKHLFTLLTKALQWSGHLNEPMSLCLDQLLLPRQLGQFSLGSVATPHHVSKNSTENIRPRWTVGI